MNVRLPRIASLPILLALTGCITPFGSVAARYQRDADRIIHAALAHNDAYYKLELLCDDVGNRISGSPALTRALDLTADLLRDDGQENVHTEKVMVPHWVRGHESCLMVEPREYPLPMLGLGGSVGTPADGITAEVEVVADEAELEALGSRARGKIILFNNPMPPFDFAKHDSHYGETVRFRGNGARLAAGKGAVAALVRSVTARSLRTPHTGAMHYGDEKVKIPAAAITTEDAAMIARLRARDKKVVVTLKMEAQTLPDAPSGNVIAELRGSTHPEEIVVIGGHIDSWDAGQGAHDDGAGVVMCMEAIHVLRQLGLRPQRTIRVVLFTNEENGLAGGRQYAIDHATELKNHVAAIESDAGGFSPRGFSIQVGANPLRGRRFLRQTGTIAPATRSNHEPHEPSTAPDDPRRTRAVKQLKDICRLLAPLHATEAEAGGSGADISPIAESGVASLGLNVEGSTYFDYHHTPADTLEKVDPNQLSQSVAAMAVMSYILADMPGRLGDSPSR